MLNKEEILDTLSNGKTVYVVEDYKIHNINVFDNPTEENFEKYFNSEKRAEKYLNKQMFDLEFKQNKVVEFAPLTWDELKKQPLVYDFKFILSAPFKIARLIVIKGVEIKVEIDEINFKSFGIPNKKNYLTALRYCKDLFLGE